MKGSKAARESVENQGTEKAVIKVGTDIIRIRRIAKLQQENPVALQRMLWDNERRSHDPAHIAGIIAAKEAAMKALSLSTKHWKDIVVNHDDGGKPTLAISHEISKKIQSMDVSISHDGEYAIAMVVAQMK